MDKSHYSEFMGKMLTDYAQNWTCSDCFVHRHEDFRTTIGTKLLICGGPEVLLCERIKAAYTYFIQSKEAEQPEPIVDDGIIRRVNVDE